MAAAEAAQPGELQADAFKKLYPREYFAKWLEEVRRHSNGFVEVCVLPEHVH